MLEDGILVWKVKNGSRDALCRLYQKYKRDMFSLANALLHDQAAAEDVVHDVFVSFVQSMDKFKLTGSLKGYLLRCSANLARDRIRAKNREFQKLSSPAVEERYCQSPSEGLISAEQVGHLREAIAKLPYDQREAVVLHLQGGETFKSIAKLREVSVSTIQSRYRYGIEKLKVLLNGEVER